MIEGLGQSAIQSIDLGSISVISIDLGSTQIWPASTPVVVTYGITGAGITYSTGTYIKAKGDNYATVTGTLITYHNNVEYSRQAVTMSVSWYTTPDTTIWSISSNQVHAANRDIMSGSQRSCQVRGYDTTTAQYYGPFTVWQEANEIVSTGAGGVSAFSMNGQTGSFDVSSGGVNLSVTTQIYRNVTYTSESSAQSYLPDNQYSYEISNNFATVTYAGGPTYTPGQSASAAGYKLSTISIPSYSDTTTNRTMTVIARDSVYNSVFATIAIRQLAATSWGWTWVTSVPLNIAYDAQSFSIDVQSTRNGEAFQIYTSMVSFRNNNINASCTSVTSLGSSKYRLNFTCSANQTTASRSVSIDITQGTNTRTCQVIQAANTSAFDGITIKATSSDGHWVLGVISGTYNGIIVAKDSPITEDASVSVARISWQWQPNSTVTPTSYTEYNLSQTITAGTTLSAYYGYYLVSNETPPYATRPNIQINEVAGFSVV